MSFCFQVFTESKFEGSKRRRVGEVCAVTQGRSVEQRGERGLSSPGNPEAARVHIRLSAGGEPGEGLRGVGQRNFRGSLCRNPSQGAGSTGPRPHEWKSEQQVGTDGHAEPSRASVVLRCRGYFQTALGPTSVFKSNYWVLSCRSKPTHSTSRSSLC